MNEAKYGIDVLAFGPHPDDVELFAGGTMIRLADLGYSTGIVDLTRGERASRGSPEERAREAEAASVVLGLGFRENLELPDAFLDPRAGYGEDAAGQRTSALARVVEVIRRVRPELVLVPWSRERHPDHVAASALVTRAVFFAGVRKVETEEPSERFVPRQVLYYQLRVRFRPSFIVDTSLAADRKRQAIACYASQLHGRAGEDATLLGAAGAVDAIEARDRYYGSMIGVTHGEALRSPGTPGLVDPVDHLRRNPFPDAHNFEELE